MISFEKAKEIAAKEYNEELLICSYSDLSDSWVFSFEDAGHKTVYCDPVRVYKKDGTAKKWSFIKNRKEYFEKLLKANIPA